MSFRAKKSCFTDLVCLYFHQFLLYMSHSLVCFFFFYRSDSLRSMKSQIIDGKKTRFQVKNHPRKKVKYYSEDLPTDKMISCHSCRTAFLCSNPSLTKDGYSCENCRMKNPIVLPFSFNPKKNLQLNGFRKKFPTGMSRRIWIVYSFVFRSQWSIIDSTIG